MINGNWSKIKERAKKKEKLNQYIFYFFYKQSRINTKCFYLCLENEKNWCASMLRWMRNHTHKSFKLRERIKMMEEEKHIKHKNGKEKSFQNWSRIIKIEREIRSKMKNGKKKTFYKVQKESWNEVHQRFSFSSISIFTSFSFYLSVSSDDSS